MITSDGYSIEQYQSRNQIVITMPQTIKTLTSTIEMVSNRRMLSEEELTALLILAKTYAERKEE